MLTHNTLLTGLLALMATSCADFTSMTSSVPPTIVQADVLHSSLLCGDDIQQPAVIWLDDQASLRQRYEQFNAQISDPVYAPTLDFERSATLLIAMGPQPSTGYLLNYIPDQDNVWLAGSTLVVSVDWVSPEPDSMQAQVITSPCLLLHVDQKNFKQVKVLDQNGEIKFERSL